MSLAFYFSPKGMSAAKYDEVMRKLDEAGAGNPKGRSHHSSFGPPEALMVYDVWDTQADFDEFGKTLIPILQEAGVDPGQPDVMPVHNVIQ
jgi:hypothetical protein